METNLRHRMSDKKNPGWLCVLLGVLLLGLPVLSAADEKTLTSSRTRSPPTQQLQRALQF
jgi:hypothetical protein